MLADGPSRRSRWRTAQEAAKPARECRWETLARSQGCVRSGSKGAHAPAGSSSRLLVDADLILHGLS